MLRLRFGCGCGFMRGSVACARGVGGAGDVVDEELAVAGDAAVD